MLKNGQFKVDIFTLPFPIQALPFISALFNNPYFILSSLRQDDMARIGSSFSLDV